MWKWEINNDVTHMSATFTWITWRLSSDILCDKKVPPKFKGMFYGGG